MSGTKIFAMAAALLCAGLPAVAAGFAAPQLGLESTATIYGLVVVVLSGAAALLRTFTTRE